MRKWARRGAMLVGVSLMGATSLMAFTYLMVSEFVKAVE